MQERILGIDTGTNSIGWAIVNHDCEAEENKYRLIDKGVNIFQEGVKIEKGIESSRAAERTDYRRLRIGYWRRKVRKINLLRILIANQLCPPVTNEDLKRWRSEKRYPLNETFMAWQRTDDKENINPYYYRNLCLTQKLDMSDISNRYIVGRALYHINQRRGFLSNRKEDTKQSDGVVVQGIDDISKAMEEAGAEYLGQYFYMLYQQGKKIRKHYTSRIEHYEKELLRICEMQGLSEELTRDLRKTIISQRPLKSQKHSVGKCVFEPKKPRCPLSHPLYEQFRMYEFINNIKIQTPADSESRVLTEEEKQQIIPLFLRKSKPEFKFLEIANRLAGRKTSKNKDKILDDGYNFNFYNDTSVSGCPVTARLSEAFEVKGNDPDEWIDAACEVYTKMGNKTRYEVMNDVWHVLFFFEDEGKLKEFAREKLQMEEKQATIFSKIVLPADYASLSLKAIRKILPYMKYYGMIYSHAVFMANLTDIVPCEQNHEALLPMLPREDADDIICALSEYDSLDKETRGSKEEYFRRYVSMKYNMGENEVRKLKKIYHPSMIETFPKILRKTNKGYFQLGSPRTGSMRNPMAMHSLFRIRHVINTLLKEKKIDKDTVIHIEFSRDLNDSNKRAAIRRWQRDRENKRGEYAGKIKEVFGGDYEPTDTDILKYQLWEEQDHKCLYTGKQIGIQDLFDPNKFDIEHTIPRSVGGDSTAMNLTICDSWYNRDVKKAQIPADLANHDEILERIATWKEKVDDLSRQIRRLNSRGVSDKGVKDSIIQKRHRLSLEYDYWKGKYRRFTMTEVPEGFSRRQGVDISIISKYARLYLKSLFPNVYIVKGIATSDFRKIWGLQDEYEKKLRVNHCHHAIDAITIACIGKAEYDKLAQYYHAEEEYRWGIGGRPYFQKPWATFTEDIKHIEDSLLVSHYTADNMGKQTCKKERKNGKFTGRYLKGDTARRSLHLDTYYGAIRHNNEEEVKYVVRKSLETMDQKDIKNIVDDVVRTKVESAVTEYGSLKEAVAKNGIWMNEEKGIRINKVRVYTPTVKHPIDIRGQRDKSRQEYKRLFHVANDSNYMMGIYVGKDSRGKERRDFVLKNCLDATRHYNNSECRNSNILPVISPDNQYPLKWSLKVGKMVLLYETTPDELYDADSKELCRRLYKVSGMSSMVVNGYGYGTISLVHHQEARPSTEVREVNGKYEQKESMRSAIKMLHTQFNALVEGCDFTLNDIGEITFLNRC